MTKCVVSLETTVRLSTSKRSALDPARAASRVCTVRASGNAAVSCCFLQATSGGHTTLCVYCVGWVLHRVYAVFTISCDKKCRMITCLLRTPNIYYDP